MAIFHSFLLVHQRVCQRFSDKSMVSARCSSGDGPKKEHHRKTLASSDSSNEAPVLVVCQCVSDTARYGVDIWMLVSKDTDPKIAELFKLCCFFGYVVLPRWCCSNPAQSAPKKWGGSPVPRAESTWDHLGPLVASACFSSLFCYGIGWVNQLVKCPCWRHKSNENSFDRGCARLDTISKQKTGGTVAAAQVEKDMLKTKKTKTLPVREEIGNSAGKDQNGWDLEKFVCLYMSW